VTPGAAWAIRSGRIDLGRPVVMGVLNLTPDSFSDGGGVRDLQHALDEAERLVGEGADVIDVGGESTRPGATEVPPELEARRVLPFVEHAATRLTVPISIDTRHAQVAWRALDGGAAIVNDVSGLAWDPDMAAVVAESKAGVVLMHMRGAPDTMSSHAIYRSVVEEVRSELVEAIDRARAAGIQDEHIVVDPGLGFAKNPSHTLQVLAGLGRLADVGYPVLVGPSRKSFLGVILDVDVRDRIVGTVATCVVAYLRGARIFRVHDVKPVVQALAVAQAIDETAAQLGENGS
jgi:dihydropteroate synthase